MTTFNSTGLQLCRKCGTHPVDIIDPTVSSLLCWDCTPSITDVVSFNRIPDGAATCLTCKHEHSLYSPCFCVLEVSLPY